MNKEGKSYSQYRAMFAIAKASLRSITRSPSAVIFSLAFPLIFIVVFGFIGKGVMKVEVGIDKNCDKNNPVYQALFNVPMMKFVEGLDEKETLLQLQKGRLDVSLNIQKNISGANPPYIVHLRTSNASAEKANIFRSVLNNIFYQVNYMAVHVPPALAELKETKIQGREYKSIDFILPGQLGFSLLSSGVFGTAFVFLSLRQTLVIKRFFATPIGRPYIILGEAISRLVFALAGALIIILIGHFLFGFTLIHGIFTVFDMLLLSTLGLIVFMGFGFAVSGIAKNESSVPPIANIITLPQFLLSGTFFSIEAFPAWLQPICKVLPLTYLNDAMRKVAFEGAGLMEIGPQLLVILIWGVLVYALAIKVFKWE